MPNKPYHPPQDILDKYADVLVNFALGSVDPMTGVKRKRGIKKGETVMVQASESAKPLYAAVLKAVWKAGGHAIGRYAPDNEPWFKFDRTFFEHAEDHQLDFFPESYFKGMVEQADHLVVIMSETDKQSLLGIDPEKIMRRGVAYKPFMEWRNEKENKGKFTWTLALYGTPAAAKEAQLSEKDYWQQIIQACFIDKKDPIAEWQKVYKQIETYRKKLDALQIEKVHVLGPDADLWITIGEKRAWSHGGGRNIPSFEIFTSPDWRGTDGWIRFNQPLFRYGNLITGIELEFKNGKVIKAKAKKGEKVLRHMIASPNADKVGEFSLTDKRFSRITKFMAETLFDENMGGPHGNTHIALGNAYHNCYKGNPAKVSKKEWKRLGYNDSPVHTDIVSTSPRTVTAYFKKGGQKIIYQDGEFTL